MSHSPEPQITFIAPDSADLAPFFPGYEFEGLIATGGMGAVYRAVQKSLDRTVAIKILPQEFGQDAAFAAGFEAEAKAMARLNHPNLIGVYDFGEVNGMLYIIMEFVPGKSLFHSAHGLAIDPSEVIRLVTGICSGLAHAHSNGILHRDIKPSNILLDLNAQPKIGDFGLARPIGTKIEDGEEIFGTPHYIAPEVCNAPQSVSHRADIFSVGVLLHELLTGRLPAEDPRPASAICQCDPRFDTIIRRATDPVPERRYASADDMARDLHAISSKTAAPRATRAMPVAAPKTAPIATPRRAAGVRSKPVPHEKSSSPVPGLFMLMVAIIIALVAYKQYGKPQTFTQIIIEKNNPDPAPGSTPPRTEVKPPRTEITPPRTEVTPPRIEVTPPGPGVTPPEPGVTPPEPGVTPPEPGVTPPGPDITPPGPDVLPKYDVPGFLTRARKIMQDRTTPLAAKHDKNIKDNFWTFEKECTRYAGKITVDRAKALTQVAAILTKMKKNECRVPENLDSMLAEIPGVPELHAEMLEKQKKFDFELRRDVNELAATYIQGLRKQTDRLKTENDPAAITLIEEEIDKTRNQSDYFSSLMLSNSPASDNP